MGRIFELHRQLAADTIAVGDLDLCRVLLMNDARYPWLILVPRRADIREVYDLREDEQALLWQEVTQTGHDMMRALGGHKLNIAALGNMVPQLHIHLVVRQPGDAAWPGPVWGQGEAEPYTSEGMEQQLEALRGLIQQTP